jgi:hypothetical protein
LNDVNGFERDNYGIYLPGSGFCHVVWAGGFEVPAAKRPATTSFPTVRVNTRSPIAWRPVDPRIAIANP